MYDGHGSTRLLTDSSGNITDRMSYDAYGSMLGGNPSTLSPSTTSLLYSGEQLDPDLKQQYLRARYFDQNLGIFNRLDPFGGSNEIPQSLHKYAYAHGNPINSTDPSGEISLPQFLVNSYIHTSLLLFRIAPVIPLSISAGIGLIRSGLLYPQQIVFLLQRGLIRLDNPRTIRAVTEIITRTKGIPNVLQQWTSLGATKGHFFIRMFKEPQRFINIARRLGETPFRYSARGFERFTNLANRIAKLPEGFSRYGEVFRKTDAAGDVATFIRTQPITGNLVTATDKGVMVIKNSNGLIKTFRDATGSNFISF